MYIYGSICKSIMVFQKKYFPKQVHCACGCGEIIFDLDKKCRPIKYKNGHWKKGKKFPNSRPMYQGNKHWNWKGGKILLNGYIMIRMSNHPNAIGNGYVAEHRLVMEEHLGRYLTKDEDVHHINGNKQDNRIENLQLLDHTAHVILHHNIRRGEI